MFNDGLELQALIDSLQAHVCLLDSEGQVVLVNQAWKDFGQEDNLAGGQSGVGQNYLLLCEGAPVESKESHDAAWAVRAILGGEMDSWQMEYPCSCSVDRRWFRATFKAVRIMGQKFVLCTHEDITAEKRMEQMYQTAQDQLDLIVSHTPDGMFFMMLDEPIEWNDSIDKEAAIDYAFAHQRTTSVNYPMLQMYKAKREEFIGLTPNDFFAHDMEHGRALWRSMFDDCSAFLHSKETKFDGTEMYVEGSYTCLHDAQGRIMGHFGIQREVTERYLTEQQLVRFRAALDNSASAILLVDRETMTVVDANNTACEASGYSRDELVGMQADKLQPEITRELLEHEFDKLGKTDDIESYLTTTFVRKDGAQVPVELFIRLACIENRDIVVVTVRDMTSARALEHRMRQIEQEKDLVLSSINERVVYHDNNMRVVWANKAAFNFFKKQPEEVIGSTCAGFSAGLERACADCPVGKSLETGKSNEKVMVYSDNSAYLVRAYPVLDDEGGVRGVVEVTLDITESVRREKELSQAIKRAQEASLAKSQFLANMSHEIRTPLNVIIGMTGLALDTELTAEQKEYMSMTNDASKALLGLINDILDFSRIESGKLPLENKPFCVRSTVMDSTSQLRLKAREKGLSLNPNVPQDLPREVYGDPLRLQQVLVNLIGNAVKFTTTGKVDVTARVSRQTEAELELEFKVTDTGKGIAPENIGRLFEPFTQIDASLTREHEGTGLGLSISQNLVSLMGGKMWVESALGKGSTFYFTAVFGLKECACGEGKVETSYEVYEARVAAATEEAKATPQSESLKGFKVLLVEDMEINRRLASTVLRKWGAEVTTANNGIEAMQRLAEGPFDCVLLDIQMPEMDGLEFTRLWRQREAGTASRIPIIAMTAHAMAGDRERFLAAGMDDYVSKPIDNSRLFSALIKVVKREEPSDHKAVFEQMLSDNDLMNEMMDVFYPEYVQKEEQLREALKAEQWHDAAVLAHGMKGALGSLGAKGCFELCQALERELNAEHKDKADELLTKLGQRVRHLRRDTENAKLQGGEVS